MGRLDRGLVVTLAIAACTSQSPPPPEPAPTAPTRFSGLVGLQGEPVEGLLQAEWSAIVLLFVSTHCPISNRYLPSVKSMADDWGRHDHVVVVLVYPDPDDTPDEIVEHRDSFRIELPVVRDLEHALVEWSGARVTPEAVVHVPGAVRPAYVGRIDDRVAEFGKMRAEASTHDLKDAVRAVLDGETPTPAKADAIGCYISDLR